MSTTMKGSAVRTPSASWELMERDRRLVRLLEGGISEIRQASGGIASSDQPGLRWWQQVWKQKVGVGTPAGGDQPGFIVQHPMEEPQNFQARLELLQYENLYWSGAENAGAMPFSHPVVWAEGTPEEVQGWEQNIERTNPISSIEGRSLRAFARWACTQSVGYGFGGLYANMAEGAERPYLSFVPGSGVLGVEFRVGNTASRPSRMRLVIKGRRGGDPNGGTDARGTPWTSKSYERVMVLYDGDPDAPAGDGRFAFWEIYDREDPLDPQSPWKFDATEDGLMRPQQAIPMVMLYTGYESEWFSRSPIRQVGQSERVWINKRSDLDYILKTSTVPMWDWAGASEDDERRHGAIMPGNIFRADNPGAHLRPAEFQGSSMKIAAEDIETLLRRIEVGTFSPTTTRPTGNELATGRAIDEARANTKAEAYSLGWASSFTQALRFMAVWRQLPASEIEKISVSFHHDFGIREREMEYSKQITQAYLAGKLRPEKWFEDLKRIGAFGEDTDAEKEAKWVEGSEEEQFGRLVEAAKQPAGPMPAPDPGDRQDSTAA